MLRDTEQAAVRRLLGLLLVLYLFPATLIAASTVGALVLRKEPPESLKRCLAAGKAGPDVALFALTRAVLWPRAVPEVWSEDLVKLLDWLLVRSDPFPEACKG